MQPPRRRQGDEEDEEDAENAETASEDKEWEDEGRREWPRDAAPTAATADDADQPPASLTQFLWQLAAAGGRMVADAAQAVVAFAIGDSSNTSAPGEGTASAAAESAETPEPPAKPPPWANVRVVGTHESRLLKRDHILIVAPALPASVNDKNWTLVYGTLQHGTSVNTFYRNMAKYNGPTIVVVRDTKGYLFGGFASVPWHKIDVEEFYGTGECFLFRLEPVGVVYGWTGANDFFMTSKAGKDSIVMGGGECVIARGRGRRHPDAVPACADRTRGRSVRSGAFGLWVDANFAHGSSRPCATFGNACLSSEDTFDVDQIEVFGFDGLEPSGRPR